jgi:hypothetical protein
MSHAPHDPTFTIDQSTSSDRGIKLTPTNVNWLNPNMVENTEPFSFEAYHEKVRYPLLVGGINLNPLQHEYPRCLDMPLRLAGEDAYVLPTEWAGLQPLLEALIGVEQQHNANWQDYYTYMTIDCKHVVADEQQRHGGLHVDGFQGTRINPKTKVTRNYVMTTNGGTRFYPKRFVVVDEKKFNVFQGFDLQAENHVIAKENEAYFMDAYTVHESGIADRDGLRTFLRLTFDLKKFDRLGNTRNACLAYDWDMAERKIHETVATPSLENILNSPYR